MKTILISTSKTVSVVDKSFTDIQTHYPYQMVEMVRCKNLPAGLVMLADEEGNFQEEPKENSLATYLWGHNGKIVGDVFIVSIQNRSNDFSGLKNRDIPKVMDVILDKYRHKVDGVKIDEVTLKAFFGKAEPEK